MVHDACVVARSLGARVGTRMADLRAALPEIAAVPADPCGDADFLRRLSRWATRWTPWTAVDVDGPDGPGTGALVLDATGCARLFGGERAVLDDIQTRLDALGLSARIAAGPTWGAAWALARFGPDRAICRDTAELEALPVAALRLASTEARTLRRLGLDTIGALRALPRSTLTRRFSRLPPARDPLIRLDQALGRLPQPISPGTDAPERRAIRHLAEPAQDAAALLPDLAETLCARLGTEGTGTRHIRLTVHRSDGEARSVSARLARPGRDPRHLIRLLEPRLERLDPGPGFDAVALEALDAERLDAAQPDLSGQADEGEALSQLIDRLSARLGPNSVLHPVPRDTHMPERAWGWSPALSGAPAGPPAGFAPSGPRPLTFLEPPEKLSVLYAVPEGPPVRLEWRRRRIEIVRHAGPERIAPEWWRAAPGTRLRDYYRIEDADGRRYWLFREGVAGDGRGGAPDWFMHGLFA